MQASRVAATGGVWPPKGIEVFDPWHLPLINTLILLTSGTTVTWAHHALLNNDRQGLKWGLAATIALGLLFTAVQAYEYAHAAFAFSRDNGGNIYGSTFFMATGFHGFHVIVGTIFLIVCLLRAISGPLHARRPISASRPPPGTGTSSTWSGSSCLPPSTSGDRPAPSSQGTEATPDVMKGRAGTPLRPFRLWRIRWTRTTTRTSRH